MKRRWKILIASFGLVAAIAVVVTLMRGDSEPKYKGRPLSDWILEARPYEPGYENTAQFIARNRNAVEAFRAIGTNAMPYMVEWLAYVPPRPPFSMADKLPIFRRRALLQSSANQVLQQMDWMAVSAIPFIEKKLQTLPPSNAAQLLGRVLVPLGRSGAIALSDCATNTNIALENRLFLIAMLEMGSRDLRPRDLNYSLAALTNCLADPSFQIRQQAQATLQRLFPPNMGDSKGGSEQIPYNGPPPQPNKSLQPSIPIVGG